MHAARKLCRAYVTFFLSLLPPCSLSCGTRSALATDLRSYDERARTSLIAVHHFSQRRLLDGIPPF